MIARLLCALALLALLPSPAAARRIPLELTRPEPAAELWGPVDVQVRDLRERALPAEAGDLIGAGRVFNPTLLLTLGIGSRQRPLHAEGYSVPDLLTLLVVDLAREAGILASGVSVSPPVGVLHVDVQEFWCQSPGREDQACELRVEVRLVSAFDGSVVWGTDLESSELPWAQQPRREVYADLLAGAVEPLRGALQRDGVAASVRQLAQRPPGPPQAVAVVEVPLEGGGSSRFTDLGLAPQGRCLTDGRETWVVPGAGEPTTLRLPAALSGTRWTTVWFPDGPELGLELSLRGHGWLFVYGRARPRLGAARAGFGGGILGVRWPPACPARAGLPAGGTVDGWLELTGRRGRPLDPGAFEGGVRQRREWRGVRLVDGEGPIGVPEGLERLGDPELDRRYERLLTLHGNRARRAGTGAAVSGGVGVLGAALIGVAGGLTQARFDSPTGGGAGLLGAEIGTRILGVSAAAVGWTVFVPHLRSFIIERGAVRDLEGRGWDRLHSPGELARAVQRHNRRRSVQEFAE